MQGRRGLELIPADIVRVAGGTAWTTCQFITGLVYKDNPPFTLKFTPTGNLEEPVNLSCMFLNCGRAENKSMNKQSILHLAYGIFSFLKIK